MYKQNAPRVLLLFLVASLSFFGCAKHHVDTAIRNEPIIENPPIEQQGNESSLDKQALQIVYFGYDSAALNEAALKATEDAARIFKNAPDHKVLIEGHCDERGTQEYNLVLGQKRADAVREQLIRLGVAPEQLQTISYGKERPCGPGQTERDYALNRRCVFNPIP